MAKAFVYIGTSVDGFIARRNDDIAWLTAFEPPPGEDYGYKPFIDSVDTIVIGRKTFETVLGFGEWPYPQSKKVVVLSSSNPEVPEKVRRLVTIRSGAPREILEELDREGSRNVYVDGGVTIQRFLYDGAIDEITITRVPLLIGDGLPLFGALPEDVKLEFRESKQFANGCVQARYRVLKRKTEV